jgi:UDP-N-acetylglucosamine 1-carboxyvinyltransferase
MDAFVIEGGRPLRGTHTVNGSKNATLPLMAAALLTDQPVVLRGVPDLSDIRNMVRLLETLGVELVEGDTPRSRRLTADPEGSTLASYDIVRTMRAGICVLGPLLAERGQAKVSMPGGCAIGDRPVDLHLRGLRALGAEIELDEGYIIARAPAGGRLIGARVFLGGPSGSTVLGTANVLSAAVLAQGRTIIESAACEPEIEDLCELLTQMGAQISGAGSPRLVVDGVDKLGGADHDVIPDRIEAGTYVMAAAITGGDVVLERFPTSALTAALDRLEQVGVGVEVVEGEETQRRRDEETEGKATSRGRGRRATDPLSEVQTVRVVTSRRLRPCQVVTQPHPGFPTDLQAQMMALLTLAEGNSIITDKIFPDRFLHVAELLRMGADARRMGPSVMVAGVRELIGAPVMASDLRASAGLIIAGLAARGTTTVRRVYHLDRGYERMERSLQALGATIERVDEDEV